MANQSPLSGMVPQPDSISLAITQVLVAVAHRFIASKPTDPYKARLEYVDRQIEKLEKIDKERKDSGIEPQVQSVTPSPYRVEPNPYAVEPNPYADEPIPSYAIPRTYGPTGVDTTREQLAVGCLPCARAHFTAIWGSLDEAIRFARDEGIAHHEVITRLQSAEKEAVMVERHDWTPGKIANSPPAEQEILRYMLPKLRELRQDIVDIDSVEDLEQATVKAELLSQDLHMQVLKSKGITRDRIVGLAQQVQNGEKTVEQAGEELKGEVAKCGWCQGG